MLPAYRVCKSPGRVHCGRKEIALRWQMKLLAQTGLHLEKALAGLQSPERRIKSLSRPGHAGPADPPRPLPIPPPRGIPVHLASATSAGLVFKIKQKPKGGSLAPSLHWRPDALGRGRWAPGRIPWQGPRTSRSGCHGGHRLVPRPPCRRAQRHFEHLPCFPVSLPLSSLLLSSLQAKRLPTLPGPP